MINFYTPNIRVGASAPILENKEGKAIYDLNANGVCDATDAFVLAENSIEGCRGRVPVGFDNLRAHVGPLGRASAREVAESMTRFEDLNVVDLVPSRDVAENQVNTILHFPNGQAPFAEFIVAG